ncbi:MAG: methyltransferase domain-containing protein, partial [Dehalococcoidia bacterium]
MLSFRHIERVIRKYRSNVTWYDEYMSTGTRQLRILAVSRLALEPGDVVLDLGCGTGLSFEYLEEAVGPDGRIIGVDVSP